MIASYVFSLHFFFINLSNIKENNHIVISNIYTVHCKQLKDYKSKRYNSTFWFRRKKEKNIKIRIKISHLSEPWLLTLPGSRGGPWPRCARAWGPQGAASFPAVAGSWPPLSRVQSPSRNSPGVPEYRCSSASSCPLVDRCLLRSIRTSVALKYRKTHQSRHTTFIDYKVDLTNFFLILYKIHLKFHFVNNIWSNVIKLLLLDLSY